MQPDILLTGFDSFTTSNGVAVSHNPTRDVVGVLAARHPALNTGILSVSFEDCRTELQALFEQHRPRIWVGLGVAMSRTVVSLEAYAVNRTEGLDNDGRQGAGQSIVPNGPERQRSGVDVAELAAELSSAGYPVEVSEDAGHFLCNQSLYLACHAAETTGVPSVAAFIHIPPLQTIDPHGLAVETCASIVERVLSAR